MRSKEDHERTLDEIARDLRSRHDLPDFIRREMDWYDAWMYRETMKVAAYKDRQLIRLLKAYYSLEPDSSFSEQSGERLSLTRDSQGDTMDASIRGEYQ